MADAAESDSAADEHAGRGGADLEMQELGLSALKDCDTTTEVEQDQFFEYVIVFGNISPPTKKVNDEEVFVSKDSKAFQAWQDIQHKRKEIEIGLKAAGLNVLKKAAGDKKKVFLLISASQQRLEKMADQMDIMVPLLAFEGKKENSEDGKTKERAYAPYEHAYKHLYAWHSKNHMFSTTQRIHLIRSIMEASPTERGANLRLDSLVRHNVITKVFPMHHKAKREQLKQSWASARVFYKPQPIEDIRNYFGEEIGLYFAWLGFFTRWLWFASLTGTICFVVWLAAKLRGETWGLWVNTVYSVFLALWATCFQEFWKRRQNTLAQRWGTTDFEDRERERADYKGDYKPGLWWKGEWLDAEQDLATLDKAHRNVTNKCASTSWTKIRMVVSGSGLLTFLAAVFAVTGGVLSFRLLVQKWDSMGGAIFGGALNAITIIIMNVFWQVIATKLTLWENHRTETEFRDQLIFKMFAFQFCNSYASFYYIAFFKGNTVFWDDESLDDGCRVDWGEDTDTVASGCIDELTMQVITILLVNMFIGQSREVAIPWVLKKLKSFVFMRSMLGTEGELDELKDEYKNLPMYEREALRVDWPGTFEEYSEMVIQYGYITMFAAVFPLAPVLALINNIVEIRTDAAKMLTAHNRPHYQGAQDIGQWYGILDVVGFFAVVTNSLLIGFSYSPVYRLTDENPFETFAVVVLLEHALLLMKYFIAVIIPDVPEKVAHDRAKHDYVSYVSFKLARSAANNAQPIHPIDNDDDTKPVFVGNADDDDNDDGV